MTTDAHTSTRYARLSEDGLQVLCGSLQARLFDRAPLRYACSGEIGVILVRRFAFAELAASFPPGVSLIEQPEGVLAEVRYLLFLPGTIWNKEQRLWEISKHEQARMDYGLRPHGRQQADKALGPWPSEHRLIGMIASATRARCPRCTHVQSIQPGRLRYVGHPHVASPAEIRALQRDSE